MTRMKKIALVLLALLCCGKVAAAAEDSAGQTYQLRLRAGQSFRTEVHLTQNVVQEVMGARLEDKQVMDMVVLEDVISVDDLGNMLVEAVYESIVFETEGIGGSFRYDTSSGEALLPMEKALKAAIGVKFTAIYAPDGRVLEIRGTDELFDRMIAMMEMYDSAQKEAIRDALAEIYSDAALKKMLSQVKGPYPPQDVGVGTEWIVYDRFEQDFVLNMNTTFRLAKLEKGHATVMVAGTLSTPPEGSPLTMDMMKLTYDLEGSQEGWYQIEEVSGWVDTGEIHIVLTGEVSVAMGPNGEVSLTWPLSMTSDMTFKSTEVLAVS